MFDVIGDFISAKYRALAYREAHKEYDGPEKEGYILYWEATDGWGDREDSSGMRHFSTRKEAEDFYESFYDTHGWLKVSLFSLTDPEDWSARDSEVY